jgi:hypothetical protein
MGIVAIKERKKNRLLLIYSPPKNPKFHKSTTLVHMDGPFSSSSSSLSLTRLLFKFWPPLICQVHTLLHLLLFYYEELLLLLLLFLYSYYDYYYYDYNYDYLLVTLKRLKSLRRTRLMSLPPHPMRGH